VNGHTHPLHLAEINVLKTVGTWILHKSEDVEKLFALVKVLLVTDNVNHLVKVV
jgi:hypothetical protein